MLLRAVTRKGFILTIHTAETSGASAVRPVFRVLLLAAGLCAVMSVAGSAPAASSPGQGAAAAGTFAPVACSEVRLQLGERVVAVDSLRGLKAARCGYLVAPENRSQPIGRTIRLAVAIVPPVSPTPAPDPIVYLAGGPGGSAIAAAPRRRRSPFAFNDCRIWDAPKAPAAQRAVTQSSTPTLLLSGTFDAVTPPSQARIAAQTLPTPPSWPSPGSGTTQWQSRAVHNACSPPFLSPQARRTRVASLGSARRPYGEAPLVIERRALMAAAFRSLGRRAADPKGRRCRAVES
jgi:hypothetical protein